MNDIVTTPPPPPPTEMVQAEDFNAKLQNQQNTQTNTTNTTNTNAVSQIPPEQLVQHAMVAGQQMMQAAQYTGNHNLAMIARNLIQTAQGVIDTQGNPYLLQQLYGLAQGGGGMGPGGMQSTGRSAYDIFNQFYGPNGTANRNKIPTTTTTTNPDGTTTTTPVMPNRANNTQTNPLSVAGAAAPEGFSKIGSTEGTQVENYFIAQKDMPPSVKTGDVLMPAAIDVAGLDPVAREAFINAFTKNTDANGDKRDDPLAIVGANSFRIISTASEQKDLAEKYGKGTYIPSKPIDFGSSGAAGIVYARYEGETRTSIVSTVNVAKTPKDDNKFDKNITEAVEQIKSGKKTSDTKFSSEKYQFIIRHYEDGPGGTYKVDVEFFFKTKEELAADEKAKGERRKGRHRRR